MCYNPPTMKEHNISLVGFMGAGKSRIAKELAAKLKTEAISSDERIVEKEGLSIAEIFKDKGEIYFRKLEKDIIAQLSKLKGSIIDCGGGVVLDPENISNLKRNGVVLYLSATVETIYNRIKDDDSRPLLNVEDPKAVISDLLDKRQSFYEQANFIVNTDNRSIASICDEIINIFNSDF